jgi:hypothetical protein
VRPYHHGMARPRVPDEEGGPRIRKVDENLLNKQSRTADKGRSSNLKVGGGANNISS